MNQHHKQTDRVIAFVANLISQRNIAQDVHRIDVLSLGVLNQLLITARPFSSSVAKLSAQVPWEGEEFTAAPNQI